MLRHFAHRNARRALLLLHGAERGRGELTEELAQLVVSEAQVTILRRDLVRRLADGGVHGVEDLADGAVGVLLHVVQEEVVPQTRHASVNVLSSNSVTGRAVRHVRVVVGIGRGHHVHVDVLRHLLEHGAGVARLHEPYPLAVQILVVRVKDGTEQVVVVHLVLANHNDTVIAVINEVGEHRVVRSGREDLGVLLARLLRHSLLVTRDDAEEHFAVDIVVRVVHVVEAAVLSPVAVRSVGRVREDHSGPRVVGGLQVGGVGHENDVLGLDSRLHQLGVHTARLLLHQPEQSGHTLVME